VQIGAAHDCVVPWLEVCCRKSETVTADDSEMNSSEGSGYLRFVHGRGHATVHDQLITDDER
jgi:hypothetical protein